MSRGKTPALHELAPCVRLSGAGAGRYRLSGEIVASDTLLPAQPDFAGDSRPASVAFRMAPELPVRRDRVTSWFERDHGVRIGRVPEGFIVELPGCVDFLIAEDGASIVASSLAGCPEETVAQLFVDQVFPLALHARGRFAFHASSIALRGRDLVAFLGHAGAGKSTLASSLARAGEHAIFSDDCLAIAPGDRGIVAQPSYASARLWKDSADALFADRDPLPLVSPRTTKLRASLRGATEPLRLARVYVLEPATSSVTITRLRRHEAVVRLAAHLYRIDATDRARLRAELDLLANVAAAVPVAALAYPRSYDALPGVSSAIEMDLRA